MPEFEHMKFILEVVFRTDHNLLLMLIVTYSPFNQNSP